MARPWSRTSLRASPRADAVRRVHDHSSHGMMEWMFDIVEEAERNAYPMGGKTEEKGSTPG